MALIRHADGKPCQQTERVPIMNTHVFECNCIPQLLVLACMSSLLLSCADASGQAHPLGVSTSSVESFLDTLAGSYSLIGFCEHTNSSQSQQPVQFDVDGDPNHWGLKCSRLAHDLEKVKFPDPGSAPGGRVALRSADAETMDMFGLLHEQLPAVALINPMFAQAFTDTTSHLGPNLKGECASHT
jgi:hypothetical protein